MLNWREIPFVRLTLPLIIGIVLALSFPYPIPYIHFILGFFFIGLIFLRRPNQSFDQRWFFGSLLYLFLLLFGYQITYQEQDILQQNHFQKHLLTSNTIVGVVTDKVPSDLRYRLRLQVEQISDSLGQLQKNQGDLLVYLDHDKNSEELAYGDRLMLNTHLRPIRSTINPYAFNFKKYWHFQNIHYQGFVKTGYWHLLKRQQGNYIISRALKTRNRFLQILKKHLPTENEYAVASALILGDKQSLDRDLKNAYSGTGAMHVLAVSGLHVGLVYLGLAFLLGFLKIRSRYWILFRTTLIILSIWAFALLTGASPSVMRAATMFSFIIIGKSMRYHPNIYNTLAASAFCLLCFNPLLLTEVGFQLSYLAVTGIIYFQPKIYRWWIIDNIVGDYLWRLITVSIAAQITTLPISLFYFHQFPLYFWLSGLVVIPAAMLVLGSGLILLFFETVFPFLSVLPATILYWTTWLMNALIFMIRQMPSALINGFWISGLTLVFLYGCLGAIVTAINTKNIRWLMTGSIALLVISANFSFTQIQQQKHRHLIIYSVKEHSLMDFIDGKEAVVLKDKALIPTKENFIAQNNRWANGLSILHQKSWNSESFSTDNFWFQNGFIQFFDQRIVVLRQQEFVASKKKYEVDLVILSNNTDWTIQQVRQQFNYKQLIFDASSHWKKIRQWTKECQEQEIEFYDVSKSGALTIQLN